MPNIFQTSELTVGELFSSNTVYVIPAYQRPYAWGEKHVDDLRKDILDTFNQVRRLGAAFPGYFVGALYTRDLLASSDFDADLQARTHNSEGRFSIGFEDLNRQGVKFVEVLDGQQRLTTLFLLRQHFQMPGGMITLKNGQVIPTVLPAMQDRYFFLELIAHQQPQVQAYSQRKLQHTQHYWATASWATGGSNGLQAEPQDITSVVDTLFRVTDHRLLEPNFAIQIFQSQNDRGKKLTYVERLKSLFMLFDYNLCHSKHQSTIQDVFAHLYRTLDTSMQRDVFFDEDEPGENEFLRTFYVLLHIGQNADVMWTSMEDTYEYFRAEVAKDPDATDAKLKG